MTRIAIVHSEGREAIYVDGVLKFDDHRASAWDMANALDLDVEHIEADDSWMEEINYLPEYLAAVVRA